MVDKELEKLLNRAILMNLEIQELDTKCKHKYYIISNGNDNDNHTIYIPKDVKMIEYTLGNAENYTEQIKKLRGIVKVLGGEGLIALDNVFAHCKMEVLDLRKLKITKKITANSIFQYSKINEILFGNEINVTDLTRAFEGGTFGDLDLNKLKVEEVKDLNWLFSDAKVKSIKFDEWYLVNLKCLVYAFSGLETEELDLRFWNLKNTRLLDGIFKYSKIERILLSEADKKHLLKQESS